VAQSSLKCKRCGKEFSLTKSTKRNRVYTHKKYCSAKCKSRDTYDRNRDYYLTYSKRYNKPIIEKVCDRCGKVFETNKSLQTHCSEQCCKAMWKKRHPEQNRFEVKSRFHKERATSDGSVTFEAWEGMKKSYNFTCPVCGKSEPDIKLTMDHIKPVSKGGTHTIDNLQPLCMLCNCKKSNFYKEDSELCVTSK
jgi:5-methylcytosine-specific restriction endonuclease McrA